MSEKNDQEKAQPDAGLAADEHPRPSQAEGDRKTVEQDIANKESSESKTEADKK